MDKKLDYSNGSKNPYTIEARHNLIPKCFECGKFIPVVLDGTDYFRYYVKGEGNIQQIFHYLTGSQREVLLSGIHPDCWDKLFEGADK